MKKIAIIEDDQHIGDILEKTLKKEGFEPVRAYSGTEALYLLEKDTPDLILLDLMLPGLCGEKLLPEIKGIPVIIVSAKTGLDDKVKMLTEGAVDYVEKPFEIAELMARIKAQLRTAEMMKECRKSVVSCEDIVICPDSRDVTVAGKSVKLTRTEYAVLKILVENAGRAMAKSAILDRISCDTPDCTESSLKIHVSNLRKKLRAAGGREYIEAVWGIGFRISESR